MSLYFYSEDAGRDLQKLQVRISGEGEYSPETFYTDEVIVCRIRNTRTKMFLREIVVQR